MLIDVKPVNDRGFLFGKFKDRYDHECSIQKSSLATEDCIWLGRPEGRMHLTQEMVADLLPLLHHFVATGDLPAYSEENCPGHVASAADPKVCGRCGVHIDSLRPDDDNE